RPTTRSSRSRRSGRSRSRRPSTSSCTPTAATWATSAEPPGRATAAGWRRGWPTGWVDAGASNIGPTRGRGFEDSSRTRQVVLRLLDGLRAVDRGQFAAEEGAHGAGVVEVEL